MGHQQMIADSASSARSAQAPENPPSGHVPSSSASAGLDKEFAISAANNLQALLFLSSLLHTNAEDSGKVRLYTHLIDEIAIVGKVGMPDALERYVLIVA